MDCWDRRSTIEVMSLEHETRDQHGHSPSLLTSETPVQRNDAVQTLTSCWVWKKQSRPPRWSSLILSDEKD